MVKKNKFSDKTFTERVLDIVQKIPKGKVLTYKEVATKAGSPNASRVVGNIMKANYDKNIPCHRVVPSNARLSGNIWAGEYNRGASNKIKLLIKEGAIKR